MSARLLAAAGRLVLWLAATFVLALLFLRALSTTETGVALASKIPRSVWNGAEAIVGSGDGEAGHDAEALVLFVTSLLAAAVVALGLAALLRWRRR